MFFWPVFSRIRTEYGGLQKKSPYSVQMRENTDQKSSEYGHFSPSSYDKGSTASVFAFSIKINLSSEVKCDFFKMSTSPTKILHILRKINNYLWI